MKFSFYNSTKNVNFSILQSVPKILKHPVEGNDRNPTKVIEEALFKKLFYYYNFEFYIFFKTISLNKSGREIQMNPNYLENATWTQPIPYTMDFSRITVDTDNTIEFSNLMIDKDIVVLNHNKSLEVTTDVSSHAGIVTFYDKLQNKLKNELRKINIKEIFNNNKNVSYRNEALFSLHKILHPIFAANGHFVDELEVAETIRKDEKPFGIFDHNENFKFFANITNANEMQDIDFERDLTTSEEQVTTTEETITTDYTSTTTDNTSTTAEDISTTTTTKKISETSQNTDTTQVITTAAAGIKSKSKTWIIVAIIFIVCALVGVFITMVAIYRYKIVRNKKVSELRETAKL